MQERRGSVVVSTSAWHAAGRGFDSRDQPCFIIRCKNLALNIRDCLFLCLSEETLKAVGPFYLVSMPGEVKDPTQGINLSEETLKAVGPFYLVSMPGEVKDPTQGINRLHTSLNHSCVRWAVWSIHN